MDALILLTSARAAGLTVRAYGDRLRVRGPASAEPLARAVLDRKADVLPILAAEAADITDVVSRRTYEPDPRGGWREAAESLALCILCPEARADGDLLFCVDHRAGMTARFGGVDASPSWRCVCTSTRRCRRPEWGDWVCACCGMIVPEPSKRGMP